MSSEQMVQSMLPQGKRIIGTDDMTGRFVASDQAYLYLGDEESQNRFHQILVDFYGGPQYRAVIDAAIRISEVSTLSVDVLAAMSPIAVLQQFLEQEK